MKKIFAGCVILIILSFFSFFAARYLDNWNDSEKTMEKDAEYRWLEKAAGLSKAPEHVKSIDELITQRKWSKARNEVIDLKKKDPELAPILSHREAEVLYRYGVDQLSNSIFFAENNMPEEMSEARDNTAKAMNMASDVLGGIANSESKTVKFSAADGAGDVSVRLAAVAISREERGLAVSKAVEFYIAALMARDDYETKVKLELLIDLKKQLEGPGKKGDDDLTPKGFQLVPLRRPGAGAASGRHPDIPF